jgi:peptide/nickel transport system ATP-binding protein
MLLVSHDLGVVQHIADSILVLREGEVVEFGSAAAVLEEPQQEYTKALIAAATL